MPTSEAIVEAGSNAKPPMPCVIPVSNPLESAFVNALYGA